MDKPEVEESDALYRMLGAVAPVLVPYTRDWIVNELWSRPGLAARDRAIVSISILVSRNTGNAYAHYLDKALDSSLSPSELSELPVHLAFCAGFGYAVSAVGVLKGIFEERGIGVDQLPEAFPALLSLEGALPYAAEGTVLPNASVTRLRRLAAFHRETAPW